MSRILNLQGLEDSASASPDTDTTPFSTLSFSVCSFSTFSVAACISLPARD